MKSKVDSNWDVMKYKYHYELEHQWDLKKRFIDAHKKKYPEDRLICLAQLFCNVHFMGCSYEDNIMKLIGELSEGIAEKNQKWEKQSFVTASDAIEARVKGRLGPHGLRLIESPPGRVKIKPNTTLTFDNFELKTKSLSPMKDLTTAAGSIQIKEDPYDSIDHGPSASSFMINAAETIAIDNPDSLNQGKQNGSCSTYEVNAKNSGSFFKTQMGNENSPDTMEEEPSSYGVVPLPPIPYEGVKQSKFLKFIHGVIYSGEQISEQFWCDRSSKNYATVRKGSDKVNSTKECRAKRRFQLEGSEMMTRRELRKEAKRRKLAEDPLDIDEHMEWRKVNLALPQTELTHLFGTVVNREPFGIIAIFRMDYAYEDPEKILLNTCQMADIKLAFSFIPPKSEPVNCKITLGGMFLSSAQGTNRKVAKEAACRLAIDHLKETSFTIVVKTAFVRDGAEVDRELNLPSEAQAQAAASVDKSLLDTNIGSRLLKMMGWSGGGLGKDSQGIEEPVTASGTVDRKGLGLNEGVEFSRKIGKLLQDYIANSDNKDMVFASDFTKEERKTIHEACRKYKLKTKSFGNEPNRQLVVSKRVRPLEIVEDLMKAGWETEKYKLLPPKSYLDRFTI